MNSCVGQAPRKTNAEGGEPMNGGQNFRDLFIAESRTLGKSENPRLQGEKDEPSVAFVEDDRVGLALSGGGIRSATFNLGLLQGLNDLKLLSLFDYLSTVSGGGYIGGWWTAYRNRNPTGCVILPKADAGNVEPSEVRHLREFGNFLAPRIGLFESETWALVVTAVGTIIPTLAAALSVLILGMGVWLLMTGLLWSRCPGWVVLTASTLFLLGISIKALGYRKFAAVGLAVVLLSCLGMVLHVSEVPVWGQTGAFLIAMVLLISTCAEDLWIRRKKALPAEQGDGALGLATLVGLVLVGIVSFLLWSGKWGGGPKAWTDVMGMSSDMRCVKWNWQILAPSLAWFSSAAAILLVRWFCSRCTRVMSRTRWLAWSRASGRFLALAFFWTLLSLSWWAGQWLHLTNWGQAVSGAGVLGGSGLFAYLQKRLVDGPKATAGKDKKKNGVKQDILGPVIPTLLAYAVVFLVLALLASQAWRLFADGPQWVAIRITFGGAVIVIGLMSVFFEPARMGMHDHYRARLCRAYLGASRGPKPDSDSRETDECNGDDLLLCGESQSQKGPKIEKVEATRPLHLICCAANDLAGDRLATLSRGAKSGVLSPHGLFVGGTYIPSERLAPVTLSAAMTAAGAAFNSNMGDHSVGLGIASHFLMSALNLRLGLWVGEDSEGHKGLPGRYFFLEMFGRTHADMCGAVHLSDGGGFENMALYELVRRHCRYIIVSDCGADPDVTFEGMGIAMRRVREDFGAEIEIDLDPLRPGPEGLARQHMVVGTIHYGGQRGFDKGMLLCFKPALTGDEPADILNYKSGHDDFPHQTTGDQFYDEAQWESYRRLGEHSARSALRFVERMEDEEKRKAHAVFSRARSEWYPSPPDFERRQETARGHLATFQAECERRMPSELLREFFAELDPPGKGQQTPVTPEAALQWMLRLIGLMEDIYLECDLAAYWNHPRNRGWMNWMLRWSSAPRFQAWWPVLRALYAPSFCDFVARQLEVGSSAAPLPAPAPPGRAPRRKLGGLPPANLFEEPADDPLAKRIVLRCQIELEAPGIKAPLVVLALTVDIDRSQHMARWKSSDYQALPGLWGSGFGQRFMDGVHQHLHEAHGCMACELALVPRDDRPLTDAGTRREITDQLEFYRAQGYSLRAGQAPGKNPILVRTL